MTKSTRSEIDARIAGRTITKRFAATVRAYGMRPALRWQEAAVSSGGAPGSTGWRELSWAQYGDQACRVAAGLQAIGVTRGERAVLMMKNRPEFHIADMGCLLAGLTPVSIYNSSSTEQIEYLVGHAHATVAFVEGGEYLERFLEARPKMPSLKRIIVIGEGAIPPGEPHFDALLGFAPIDLTAASEIAEPSDIVTMIYTSGTTGNPKAVVLDHANVCWTVESLWESLTVRPVSQRLLSYLPMAHVAERMNSHYLAATYGLTVSTCPDAAQLLPYLQAVRPQLFFAVPRVWEKMHAGLQAILAIDPDAKKKFEEQMVVGRKVAEVHAAGEKLTPAQQVEWDAIETEAFGPVRELIGLRECQSAISGAAPIPVEVLQFFLWIGLPISEIYGLSETCGPLTWEPFAVKPGTVGTAIPGSEVRLADDGEVLFRGGNVFRGYYGDPDRTAEALDSDGWLHTGDIGVLDEDGYLKIVDRKKELIVTAGGKNVSPANLESALKVQPLIGQACVVGDGKPYIAALIVLDPDAATAWSKAEGIEVDTLADVAADQRLVAKIQASVDTANDRFSSAEQIKRFCILTEEWLPDSEELTPTMKLKRRGVKEKYAKQIEALYSEGKRRAT